MRQGVLLWNVGDPAALADWAADIEADGWDGVFVWDHLQMFADRRLEMCDPWMLLGVMATRTRRLRLGTGVTPVSRRRPWKLAKEVVTLDHLSRGRAVLGVGLGGPDADEFHAFGDYATRKERAARTDEALPIIDRILRGESVDHAGDHYEMRARLLPAAYQDPRPPIWIAATPPYQRPLRRAARWDGVFVNARTPETEAHLLSPAELADYLADMERPGDGFDVVAIRNVDHPPEAYREIGVTWLLESVGPVGQIDVARKRLRERRPDTAIQGA